MKKIQKGFTLIELMIVVAIIGILAAVAIPAYQDYVVKAKLSKVGSTLDPLKLALAMYLQENGSFPSDGAGGLLDGVTAAQNQAGTAVTAATFPVWASLGLANVPTLPGEVANLSYFTNVSGSSFAIVLTLQNIKANTIDLTALAIAPTKGVTLAGVTATVPAADVVTGTALNWYYDCSVGTATGSVDSLIIKYFTNPDKSLAC